MPNTSVPIEIATAIKTALDAVVPSGTAVYARGIKTDVDGTVNESATSYQRACPFVEIIVSERAPMGHASVLWSYPVRIRAVTSSRPQDDPFAVDLYNIGQAIGAWLCGPPSISLTLAKFDALYTSEPPDVDSTGEGGSLQYMEYSSTCFAPKVATA
jgi:hypothetical protein